MSTGRHRKARRSEEFAVRRWLQAGAMTAGVGAALLGFGIVSSEIGTAAADTGSESASTKASNAGPSSTSDSDTTSGSDSTAGDKSDDDADDDADADKDVDADAETKAASTRREPKDDDVAKTVAVETDPEPMDGVTVTEAPTVEPDPESPSPYVSQQSEYQRRVAGVLDDWTAKNQAWVDSLDVSDERKERLQQSFLAMRRTFFNQAPTVAPVQISGVVSGPVTGTLGAEDPDGDKLVYIIVSGPKAGSVKLDADGTYSYTPGEDFGGVDTFRVAAIDVGLHVNLLQFFRPIASGPATSLVNQGAVTFDFTFTDGSQYWTPVRRDALQDAANDLVEYFRVTKPVSLTYNVKAENDAESSTLASASSPLSSNQPGFWGTVIQTKLQSGTDANGAAADGEIEWNFGDEWALGEEVPADEYDFRSVAVHELLHSFGFSSRIGASGNNDNRDWTVFAGFVVDRRGVKPIGAEGEWDAAFNPNLTGGDGGLYFGGAAAIAAYGGLVPLFTPSPWQQGSSMGHLDDATFTGADEKLMNARTDTGPAPRILSDIELGILTDIGYLVYPKVR